MALPTAVAFNSVAVVVVVSFGHVCFSIINFGSIPHPQLYLTVQHPHHHLHHKMTMRLLFPYHINAFKLNQDEWCCMEKLTMWS